MRIYKYILDQTWSESEILLPKGFKILDVQLQGTEYALWALVDPESEPISVNISIYGTGEYEIPEQRGEYISTIQDNGYVWHFFYKIKEL